MTRSQHYQDPPGWTSKEATRKLVFIQKIIRGLTWKTCLVYLDDIMVMEKTFEEHLINLKEIFNRIKETNLKLNTKKCLLFQNEVEFLGYTVSANGNNNHVNLRLAKTKR